MSGPTNADIMREIKTINKIMSDHGERLTVLEHWKIAYDAANEALAQYRADHKPTSPKANLNKDFVNVVLKLIGLLATALGLLYLVLQSVLDKA